MMDTPVLEYIVTECDHQWEYCTCSLLPKVTIILKIMVDLQEITHQ